MSDDEVNDMTGMRIDKHSFDRMAVRLDDAERQRVIVKQSPTSGIVWKTTPRKILLL